MSFHVGQKVVCVDDSTVPDEPGPYVKNGAIYTVCEIEVAYDGDPLLHFDELHSVSIRGWSAGYIADRFRPLVEDRKSVSFTIGAPKDSERWDNRKKIKEKI